MEVRSMVVLRESDGKVFILWKNQKDDLFWEVLGYLTEGTLVVNTYPHNATIKNNILAFEGVREMIQVIGNFEFTTGLSTLKISPVEGIVLKED